MLDGNANLKQVIDGFDNLKNTINEIKVNFKNKLNEKGVYANENDTLSSLVNKINLLNNLDVIVSSSLPNEVVNDRLVIITDSVNNIRIGKKTNLEENDIFIPINYEDSIVSFNINNENKFISIEIYEAYKIIEGVETIVPMYVGRNGEWIKTTVDNKYLFKEGKGLHSSVGNITSDVEGLDTEEFWYGKTTITNKYIELKTADLTSTTYRWQSDNEIDFTPYKKLTIDCLVKESPLKVILGSAQYSISKGNRKTVELDISNVIGKYKLEFRITESMYEATSTIYNMLLSGSKI